MAPCQTKGIEKGKEFAAQSFNNFSNSANGGSLKGRIVTQPTSKQKGVANYNQDAQGRFNEGPNSHQGRGQFSAKGDSRIVKQVPREISFNAVKNKLPEVSPSGSPLHHRADPFAEERLFESMKIEGRCTDLEKPFYRLTEIPEPSEVRPESVLRKALPHVLAKFAGGLCDVHFVVDQFKSIRLVGLSDPGHEDSENSQQVYCRSL